MKLDAHQHFWRYSPAEYPWIPSGSPLQQDWLPEDLAALQRPLGFDGSIAVQARQSLAETKWLLELAESDSRIQGVVGWVDLQADDIAEQLTSLARHRRLVGLRHVVQDEPDDVFMLRPAFLRGIEALRQADFTYDLLVYPRQLPAAIELVRRFPEQSFVLDHGAKPLIKAGQISPWREQIQELAQHPHVYCKISGLITEADHQHWQPADLWPYLDVLTEAFGARRLMFGTDWPVCLLAGSYATVEATVRDYFRGLAPDEAEGFWGRNCADFYFGRD